MGIVGHGSVARMLARGRWTEKVTFLEETTLLELFDTMFNELFFVDNV